jgi:hypothetical protein
VNSRHQFSRVDDLARGKAGGGVGRMGHSRNDDEMRSLDSPFLQYGEETDNLYGLSET